MTIPRKGRRGVRVGDGKYAWRIRKKPTYTQGLHKAPMTLAVQSCEEGALSVLVVDLKISRPDNWVHPHQTAVTPSMVRQMIAQALEAGWRPLEATGPFHLEFPLITDRP